MAIVKVYIDFDSCFYNIVRRVFKVAPWTIITNKYNHIISTPHWLEGHFGVKKIAYLAPPIKIKLKVSPLVRVLNIDRVPNGRKIMAEFSAGVLEGIRAVAPNATIIHKDSIAAEAECSQINKIGSTIKVPYTIGVGQSEEEAKNDCNMRRAKKKKSIMNTVLFLLYVIPMTISYLLRSNIKDIKGGPNAHYEELCHASNHDKQ